MKKSLKKRAQQIRKNPRDLESPSTSSSYTDIDEVEEVVVVNMTARTSTSKTSNDRQKTDGYNNSTGGREGQMDIGDGDGLDSDSDCQIIEISPNVEAEEVTLIGVVQMTSTIDKEANKKFCFEQIMVAKGLGAKMVFLPECFDFVATSEECIALAEPLDGPLIQSYQELAQSLDIYLSLGGFHQRTPYLRPDGHPFLSITHVIIDDCGKITSVYEKIHLFDRMRPFKNINMRESELYLPGTVIQYPVMTPIGRVGLGVNYDLRFPEYALKLRMLGASVLTYPTSFTIPNGRDHWEVLIRCRAIDNQCFVIAAAQYGKHQDDPESYGHCHSMVVDPRGKVLTKGSGELGVILVSLKRSKLESVREEFPTMLHRRVSVYNLSFVDQRFSIPSIESAEEIVMFGQIPVKMNVVFLESRHSRAIVNRKCIVPGHVLVIPKKPALRLQDLSEVEVADVFQLTRHVENIMESIHNAKSSTISVQDGVDAGQTVNHVHVHILPRQPQDFSENDKIYQDLAKHDKEKLMQWRRDSDMQTEANAIRKHIHSNFEDILWELPDIDKICIE